ncbi:L-rhamnose mutarotase [Olivibacter sp. SDN3]|uniref:L-rhamnose mutarotase n=1 Tax=Olivibacter sp. SDN3 TaxID=2764720 RepID=UPI0016518A45|nr:L-rhamnose mutarotase [Olivibacter sp. SDN3]QNL49906.1 L-rhamnose mutarotase [Olivibacter sp. SDN3]
MEEVRKDMGYPQKKNGFQTKRYCQTLELKDDPLLIDEYVRRHSLPDHWPEIREGIRSVGILEMEIYHVGTTLFMVIETPLDFNWEQAFKELSKKPRQAEWEKSMNIFQDADSILASAKWKIMERIFHL